MKRKLIVSISGIVILLILSLFAFKFIHDSPYRNRLPEYPDFKAIPEKLQDQILIAGRKARLNPTIENIGDLGMVYYSSAYYDNASSCFQLAVEKDSGKWIWSYYLGCLNLELGKSNEAIESFRHVIGKDPENMMALYYIAEASHNIGSIDDAEKIYRKIAAMNSPDLSKQDTIRENFFPLQTYALLNIARIYLETGRLDSAQTTLEEIIGEHINFGPAYRLLGNVCTAKGDISSGKKYTIRANDLVSFFPPPDILIDKITLISRSDIYLMKQIDDALRSLNFNWELKLFDQALKYVPESKPLLSKVLSGYLYLGYKDKVLPYLDEHLKYISNDFEELLVFATLLYSNGLKTQAMTYFNQAKNISPGDSRLTLWLIDRKMINEGLSLLNEQLIKDSENVTLLTNAVRVFSSVGDKSNATLYLNSLERILKSGEEIKKLKGEILENDGRMSEALSVYEDAIKIHPKDMFLVRHLANIYSQNQSWDKLIRHYRVSLEYLPNEPFLLEGLGKTLVSCPQENLRNIDEGMEYSERAFINYKSSVQIQLSAGKTLATAYAMAGDKFKASSYIKSTLVLAKKLNLYQEYNSYFWNLKKEYNFSN